MSKYLGLAVAAATSLFAAQASAATVTQTFFTGTPAPFTSGPSVQTSLPFTNVLPIQQFDGSAGTLNSVSISVNGTVVVTARVTNVGPPNGSPATVQNFSNVDATAAFTVIVAGTPNTTVLNTIVSSTPFSGTIQPTTRLFGPATTNNVSGSTTLANSSFTGSGTTNLSLTAATGNFTVGGDLTSSLDVGAFASAALTVVVTYDFTAAPPPPTGVPEPASLALLGLGLAAVGVIRRRV